MQNLDTQTLDKIVKQTIESIENSKSQIFDIYEAAKNELENVKKDVEKIKKETVEIIFKVDELEKKERRGRLRLMEVSRNFRVYSEDDIKAVYEEANQLQIELAVAREKEENLRRKRDELEMRMKKLIATVKKAETLASQLGAALGFMGSEMGSVLTQLETLQQKQMFGTKIIKAQEEERRRVSREIHDGPAQAMANIAFRSEVCERLLDTDVERCRRELIDLREQVRQCLRETRKIIFDLRPMTLDDLGLVPTLKRILDTLKQRTRIVPELKVLGEEKRLDAYIEVGLFRIIQEALNNIEKHAEANNVYVRVDFRLKMVTAVIEDDGKGFNMSEHVGRESFGLMGMKERINLLGGELEIKSQVGQGTKILIKVPLT